MNDFETVPAPKDGGASDWESETPAEEPNFLADSQADDGFASVSDVKQEKKEKNKTLMIVLIVAAVLLVCCCCVVLVSVIGGLGSAGPAIEDVFDDIMRELTYQSIHLAI